MRLLSWKDVERLLSYAKLPLLLKGVLNPDDADRAVKTGVAGIMVSNHGGRNLDTAPATIDALPLVADKVAGRVPVLVDGGIRRGTDVLKALGVGRERSAHRTTLSLRTWARRAQPVSRKF